MQEPHPAGDGDDRHIFQRLLGYYDAPAFMRRQKRVEDAERLLTEHLTLKRSESLAIVALRLGQLHALAGSWEAVPPLLAADSSVLELQVLHETLQPVLRVPLTVTTSARVLRGAMRELIEAIGVFNARWQRYLAAFDLQPLNELRDGYNRHYLIEKECALGNARVARLGFRRLEPLTTADLLRRFPLLAVPRLTSP